MTGCRQASHVGDGLLLSGGATVAGTEELGVLLAPLQGAIRCQAPTRGCALRAYPGLSTGRPVGAREGKRRPLWKEGASTMMTRHADHASTRSHGLLERSPSALWRSRESATPGRPSKRAGCLTRGLRQPPRACGPDLRSVQIGYRPSPIFAVPGTSSSPRTGW
jgi:hypothetical protein